MKYFWNRALPTLLLSSTMAGCMHSSRYGDRHMFPGFSGGWGMGTMGILFWIIIVAAIVLLVRMVKQGQGGGNPVDRKERTPLEVLKERYARGEIDKEEYESKRNDLLE